MVKNSDGRRCTRCKAFLPFSCFYPRKDRKSGYMSWCKDCVSLYRIQNPDRVNKSIEKSKEHRKLYLRQYYLDHRREILDRTKRWGDERKDLKSKYDEVYRKENKEKKVKYDKEWHKAHRENNRVNFQNRRSRISQVGGVLTLSEWNEILHFYNYTCLCCGRNDVPMTVDHIIPIKLGGTNSKENIQPLCKSCNSKKNAKIIDYRNDAFLYIPMSNVMGMV